MVATLLVDYNLQQTIYRLERSFLIKDHSNNVLP